MFCTTLDKLLIFKLSPVHFFYYPGKPDGSKPSLRNFWPCFNCIIIMENSGIRLSATGRDRSVLCWFLYHADREGILLSDQWFLTSKGHIFPSVLTLTSFNIFEWNSQWKEKYNLNKDGQESSILWKESGHCGAAVATSQHFFHQ